MLRALRFIVVAAALLAVAWLIGSLPGVITARSGPYIIQTSVPVAILALLVVVVFLTTFLHFFARLRGAPGGLSAWRGGRRRRLGETAIQRGIVALAAGDAAVASAEARRARNQLGDTPLALLLAAESARLAGRPDEAAASFQALTKHTDMAFLGHRGLLRHRLAAGDHDAAETHAKAAEASYPNSAWLRGQRRDLAIQKQDWPVALGYAQTPAETAAFATAAASATADPQAAVRYGKQAVKADPKLAPAVVAEALALRQTGGERAARKVLLAGWAAAPHPDIATAYLAPSMTPIERARAAADLAAARPGHFESELVLAETALKARLTGEAQRHAEAALAANPTDPRPGRVLAALGHGASNNALAPSSAVWVCTACHAPSAEWAPLCPRCKAPASLVWSHGGTALA